MKKIDLGQTISILANLGVIAGIVFLGVELRQNNELMGAQARYNSFNARTGWFDRLSDSQVAELIARAQQGEDLTPAERFQLDSVYMKVLSTYQWIFQEATLGAGTINANGIRTSFGKSPGGMTDLYPGLRELWDVRKTTSFPPDFVEWMEKNVVN